MSQPYALVVDDEATGRELVSIFLEMLGWTALTAADSAQAQALLETVKFDLVVTDLRLRGETGADITALVRRFQPDTKVLMISGDDEDVLARAARAAGANGFLPKPLTDETLGRKIAELTAGTGAG